jgi:RimJ/RimL family protein N-acetyltransferase
VIVLETDRLVLRRISTHDAEFILRLLNEPSFLRYIGDRGVRTLEDAQAYIAKGPVDSYDRHGFGLFLVSRRDDGVPIGMCGLLKRDTLRDVDVGFAFLPEFWGHGYAFESASAVLSYGKEVLGLGRIVAITSPDNDGSIRVLTRLGMRFEGMIQLTESEPEVRLFA